MRKVLITGSNGFIGTHLKKELEKNNIEVVKFDRENNKNIVNIKDFNDLPKTDVVFHLAAVSGYESAKRDSVLSYKVNVSGTINILEYCRKMRAKLIFPSTYVYKKPYDAAKKETDITMPTTHYSHTKFMGEKCCQFYSRTYKTDTLILRTANVYGPDQAVKYIVPIIVDHLVNNKPLILTKPEIERSYVYIDDVVQAYILLAQAKTSAGEIYNVAPQKSTTLKELVELLENISGKKLKLSYSGISRPNDVPLNRFNVEKIKEKIGWEVKVNLEEGLKQYLASIKN